MVRKRSYGTGFAQQELFPSAPTLCEQEKRTNTVHFKKKVGGRRGPTFSGSGGGGYLKNCGVSNFQIPVSPPPDPRLTELERIGIGGPWLRLARRVGFDAFLEIWRAISEDEAVRHDGGRRMPKLREFRAYERFQRNEYIRSLARNGVEPEQARRLVRRNLGEQLSLSLILGVMRGSYNRSDG